MVLPYLSLLFHCEVYFDNVGKILYIALDNSQGSPNVLRIPFNTVTQNPPSFLMSNATMIPLTPTDLSTTQTLSCGVMHTSGLYLFISRVGVPTGSRSLYVVRMNSTSLAPALLDFTETYTLVNIPWQTNAPQHNNTNDQPQK